MDRTKFFVDELALAGEIVKKTPSIDHLGKIVETAEIVLTAASVCRIYFIEDFYSLTINGDSVAQIMFGDLGRGEFRDVFLRIQILLDQSETCTDAHGAPTSGFRALATNGNGGWISLNSPSGNPGWKPELMQWISNPESFTSALRQLYICCGRAITSLDRYAQFLFPQIYFYAKASDVGKTKLSYTTMLPTYFEHLAYLNDYAIDNFKAKTQPHEIIASAGAVGVEISPESPSTHKNNDAMKERNITIDNATICCEWHTKLTKTQGRIHFFARKHPDENVFKVVGEKVIVGIITDHLS
ncbi:MAG TPA: hypothetical protein VLC92_14260 [Rhodocyclaceae bacterium]|nr:hypothetical protein [Rhodocyclaceae bacterium]